MFDPHQRGVHLSLYVQQPVTQPRPSMNIGAGGNGKGSVLLSIWPTLQRNAVNYSYGFA